MPMTVKMLKLKTEVDFQNGPHLYSETGSSNILAMD